MPVKRLAGVQGPAIRALDPWVPGNRRHRRTHQLLSDGERARLAVISSVLRFKKGAEIYREGDNADAIFNIISGVVKVYTQGPGNDELVRAFLFSEDLFGLAQEGRFVNSAKAVTPVTAYRIPIGALRTQFSTDAALEFHVIAKLCHDLRQAQRHAFVLASTVGPPPTCLRAHRPAETPFGPAFRLQISINKLRRRSPCCRALQSVEPRRACTVTSA